MRRLGRDLKTRQIDNYPILRRIFRLTGFIASLKLSSIFYPAATSTGKVTLSDNSTVQILSNKTWKII